MDISRRSLLAFSSAAAAVGMLSACSAERETATTAAATDAGTEPASTESAATGGELIGIAMPTKSLERWNRDGAHLESLLKEDGFSTSLQYADNKQDQQNNQLQNMLNDGAKVLVIASIDGTALAPILADAKSQDITVIAYDRLINGTDNVDYYATFDNYGVGKMQGEFIVEQLDLENTTETFNLEPFAGSPDDNNAKFFFSGAWDVLLPYVEAGTLVVPSGKAPASNDDWQSIGIQGWSSDTAQSEMENRLNSFYGGGKKVNIVLSPNDSLALGIEQALEGAGYKVGTDWPLVTGQDADLANVKAMLDGKQAMTVWKDTRKLGEQVAKMVDQVIKGGTVEVNDEKTYDNGVKVVPTFLVEPEVVTKDTVKTALVDSGFYKAADLGL